MEESPPPTISINPTSEDGAVNALERLAGQTISGNTGEIEPGSTVTVTLLGKNYTTSVQEDGSWTVEVPSTALVDLPDGEHAISASVTDATGDTATASQNLQAN